MKKTGKRDFLASDLPKTRKALIIDIIRNQWNILMICALYFLLAFLPFIVYRYHHLITLQSILSSDQMKEEQMTAVLQSTSIYLLVSCALFLWIGFFLAGLMRIYKRLSFQEGVFSGGDFIQGMKENRKDFFITFLLYDFCYFIVEYIAVYFMISNQMIYYLMKIIHYGILLPVLVLSLYTHSMYQDKTSKKIYTGIIVYIRFLPKNLLLFGLVLLPLSLLLISTTYMQIFLPVFYVLCYLPVVFVAIAVMTNGHFDQMINQYRFPALMNKGLYKD